MVLRVHRAWVAKVLHVLQRRAQAVPVLAQPVVPVVHLAARGLTGTDHVDAQEPDE